MLLQNPGKLRPIYRIDEFTAPEEGVDIVIVPGVWMDHPVERFKNTCSWIKPLAASMPIDTRVFMFSYNLEIDGSSLWQQLLGQSVALIRGLDLSREQPGFEQRPLLLICHSLGGLIVKRALTLPSHSRQTYEDVTSGIIFLGTPHMTSTSADGWDNIKLVMKSNRKDVSKQNMTDIEKDMIVTACRQFEDLQLIVPILTVCELRESKLRENLFRAFQSKGKLSTVLVTRAMAQISTRNESIFEVSKAHLDLYEVDINGPYYERLTQFFSAFAHYAPPNTQLAFRQVPNDEHTKTYLRTRSSISSFPDTSSNVCHNEVKDRNNIEVSKPTNDAPTGTAHESPLGSARQDVPEGVLLPFSHLASIPRNQDFHGQEFVLEKIDEAFELKSQVATDGTATSHEEDNQFSKPKTYVLCGMGGIGKTESAIEYMYTRSTQFDAIFWIFADTTRKLGTQFVTLAKEIGKEGVSDSLDGVSAREIVKNWLAAPTCYQKINRAFEKKTDATWLMVFDNADDPDILYDWLPAQGPGCILVTSRYPYIKENVYRLGNGLDLAPLSPEDGGKMLRKLSERQEEADAVATSTRIVELLGGLPLAISQMSGIIRQKHLTLKDFEEWYREDSKALHSLKVRGMLSNYQYTIGTAWAVEQLSVSAQALLKVLSVLDPDRVPEELLMDGMKDVNLPNYPAKKHRYFSARAELIHGSLVSRNMATNELRIHRLIQDVARETMEEEELYAVHAAVAILLSAVWPYVCGTDPTRNQSWRIPIAERYTTHISRSEFLVSLDIRLGKYEGTATSGHVYCSYAWYIFERGLSDQTEIFASLARIILEKAIERRDGDEERNSHWLGEAHHNLSLAAVMTGSSDGMYDANAWVDILLDRIKKFGNKSEAICLATAYNQLGICHIHKKHVEEAMDNFKKSVTAYQNLESRPAFSGTFPSLSLANLYVQRGQPEEGKRVLLPMLEEHERLLGQDDTTSTESGHIWRIMGNICNAEQRYEEGLKYHERAVENMKVTLGEKHYFTGDCLYSAGVDCLRQGNDGKAMENLNAAINAFTAAKHREAQAARAIWKKACLLKSMGDEVASKDQYQRLGKIWQQIVPNDYRKMEELRDEDWKDLIIYWSL